MDPTYQAPNSYNAPLDWTTLPGDVRDLIFGTQSLKTLGILRLVCRRYLNLELYTQIFFKLHTSWRTAATNIRCTYGGSENVTVQKLQGLIRLFPKCNLLSLRLATRVWMEMLSKIRRSISLVLNFFVSLPALISIACPIYVI